MNPIFNRWTLSVAFLVGLAVAFFWPVTCTLAPPTSRKLTLRRPAICLRLPRRSTSCSSIPVFTMPCFIEILATPSYKEISSVAQLQATSEPPNLPLTIDSSQ